MSRATQRTDVTRLSSHDSRAYCSMSVDDFFKRTSPHNVVSSTISELETDFELEPELKPEPVDEPADEPKEEILKDTLSPCVIEKELHSSSPTLKKFTKSSKRKKSSMELET